MIIFDYSIKDPVILISYIACQKKFKMTRLNDIIINDFQLNILLNEEKKKIYKDIVNQNVYCSTCSGLCEKGIEITDIHLDPLNDIRIQGICRVCRGKVSRIMEFGEDEAFYQSANKLRKAINQ